MGVLDDAIREHLDLKRRRGADPGEVEKQAAEALGPARREPAAEPLPEEVPADAPSAVEEPLAVDEPVAEEQAFLEEEPALEEEPIPETEPRAEVTQLHAVDEAPAPAPDLEEPPEPDEVPAEEQMAEKPDDDPLWFEQRPRRGSDPDE